MDKSDESITRSTANKNINIDAIVDTGTAALVLPESLLGNIVAELEAKLGGKVDCPPNDYCSPKLVLHSKE